MKMWRRYGSTGTSTPAIRPIERACGPAALTTVRVSIVPRVVSTRGDPAGLDADAGHLGVALDRYARRLRRLREPHRDAVRIGDAVALAEGGAGDAVDVEPGRQRAPPAARRATARRRRGCAAARRSRETSRRSPAPTAGTGSRPGGSRSAGRPRRRTARTADRLDGEADVRLVRELVAHAAGVATGRSGAEQLLALDEHDVGDAAAREVVGHACAHAAAADDDDIGRRFHRRRRRRERFWVLGSGFTVLGSAVQRFGVLGSRVLGSGSRF